MTTRNSGSTRQAFQSLLAAASRTAALLVLLVSPALSDPQIASPHQEATSQGRSSSQSADSAVAQANLLRNPSFEMIPGPQQGEGLMPSEWVIISVTPDTYSDDGSYGLPPNAFGNFSGVVARDGLRWVAAWGTTTAEMFGQQLSSPLLPGQAYRITGWLHQALRTDLANPGTYELLLSTVPPNPETAVALGRFVPTTGPVWEARSLTFTAPPDSTSRPWLVFRPIPTGAVMSTYPALDALSLDAQPLADCNGNGVPDSTDLASGASQDVNANQVPDECEDPSLLVAPRLTQAIEQLRQESLIPPKILFTRGHRPIPHFALARVPLATNFPPDPVAGAIDFLARHRKLFDVVDPLIEFYPVRIRTESDGIYLSLGQRRGGIPVHGASLIVRLNPNQTEVQLTNGYYVPGLPTLPPPTLLAQDAVAAAMAHVPGPNPRLRANPKLMYFNEGLSVGAPGETRLAWRIMLRGGGTKWEYFVDAHNGVVLSGEDLRRTNDKDFDFYTANQTNSEICWDFSAGEDDTDAWFDEEGPCCEYPDCAEVCPAGCDAPNCSDLGCDTDGDNLYCFAHQVYDYFNDVFDWDSFDNDDEEVEAYVHWNNAICPDNAASDADECLLFCDQSVTLDIFAHEFNHQIIYETSELGGSNQPGALAEHYGDVFGAMIDGNWTHGEGSPGGGCALDAFGALAVGSNRDMANPQNCNDPDHMSAALDTAGRGLCTNANNWCGLPTDSGAIHINTGIPNKVAFLITDGGTHTGLTIAGIGRAKAEHLYFRVMRHLPVNAQFIDQQSRTVARAQAWADDGSHGFTDADVCSVVNAFASVGLGSADMDCDGFLDPEDEDADGDGFVDTEDHCPGLANWNNADTDRDGFGDACDPDKDNDGILDDGDGSGVEGDAPCHGSSVNCDDNCSLNENPLQEDSNANGRGEVCDDRDRDFVMDAYDNCVSINNPGQADTDGDCPDPLPYLGGGCGDACDADADNDGIWDDGDFSGNRGDHPCTGGATFNCDDNCPLVPNADQLDADSRIDGGIGDGVGDLCDNCDGRGRCDFVYNPSQTNTDGDVCGDECDDDDDDDGVLDDEDNCPFVDNPDQFDFDLNGIGSLCDSKEAIIFDGLPSLNGDPVFGWIGFLQADATLRIPIAPCAADECPEYLPENFRTQVTVTVPFADMRARIADDQGLAVARTRTGSVSRSFEFFPTADFHYVPTGAVAAGAQPFQGRRYFLELGISPKMAIRTGYPLSIGVRSAIIEPDDDADGVSDTLDACPNTIPGVPVDMNGCPPPAPGDLDLDGDMDLRDFAGLGQCLSGPGTPNTISTCAVSDLNTDQRVDLRDCAAFQRCFSSSQVPVEAGCGD